jgi:hypothetical protein
MSSEVRFSKEPRFWVCLGTASYEVAKDSLSCVAKAIQTVQRFRVFVNRYTSFVFQSGGILCLCRTIFRI